MIEPPVSEPPVTREPAAAIGSSAMSDKTKELRKSMSASETALMMLTIVSASISLYLVGTAADADSLIKTVIGMTVFYGAWALLNLFTTKPYEKGHFAFFTCTFGCASLGKFEAAKYFAVVGSAAVVLAFLIAGKRIFGWPATKTAYVSKKPLYWVYVIQVYFAMSLVLWGLVTYKLVDALIL